MRSADETIRRWRSLFETSVGVDLREAIRDESGVDPCESGLRSVCWKSFLLLGPLSARTWPKRLAESRSAYNSLRDHFLRFIDHPNDLHSSTDPLADDDQSPWSTLRQDELNREEIFNDVTRCMQDNFFFREPETQRRLLNILFIWSKLNPDTGYRQGMHELLAPLLWVVNQDAIDASMLKQSDKTTEGAEFMVDVLRKEYIEHDAFSLFCAVMQTEKGAYEIGDGRDSSSIVERSRHLHEDLLSNLDSELALHLNVVGVVPQIYAIRWIRLLFGRELGFQNLLKLWDILFAESLRKDVVNLTCIVVLLRMRWKLIEADYATAITSLTHADLTDGHDDPRSLVRDALVLDRQQNDLAAADLVERYSGLRPKVRANSDAFNANLRVEHTPVRKMRTPQHRSSPAASPARFASSQKQLETIFQQVSGGIQSRTEGWNVSKAVRGAVGEVKRNMNNFQPTHSRQSSRDIISPGSGTSKQGVAADMQRLQRRLSDLDARNKAMAKMLDTALEELRSSRTSKSEEATGGEEAFNIALAKIQFVSVYMSDSEIPIPPADVTINNEKEPPPEAVITTIPEVSKQQKADPEEEPSLKAATETIPDTNSSQHAARLARQPPKISLGPAASLHKPDPPTRPTLAESAFSFMLGENQHRSGFVSSIAEPPSEQRRGSDANTAPKQLRAEDKAGKERKGSASKDDGFTMTSIRGGQRT